MKDDLEKRERARLMMQSTQLCPIRHYKTSLQTLVLLMVLFPTSTEWGHKFNGGEIRGHPR